ncbi:CLI_3235 family bacteriocin precursor [Paenibacillus donghaensis]|uniref:Putative bacteriocin n=1 Tax=Paenibacillus donghaensis TaxID=414771 RepID=A0A2Z2KNW5_9BACL|nr:CLI_3235 family bacteriocin precursor [Paenibacillus donghaensis]ASA25343.1 putative bacteriocin precursor [Paenibacillus donghaensis]
MKKLGKKLVSNKMTLEACAAACNCYGLCPSPGNYQISYYQQFAESLS